MTVNWSVNWGQRCISGLDNDQPSGIARKYISDPN